MGFNDDELGKEWLIQRFGSLIDNQKILLPELEEKKSFNYIDDSVLESFEYNNVEALNYLIEKRHLNLDVIRQFKIGFNPSTRCVTFPVWSTNNRLVGIF